MLISSDSSIPAFAFLSIQEPRPLEVTSPDPAWTRVPETAGILHEEVGFPLLSGDPSRRQGCPDMMLPVSSA